MSKIIYNTKIAIRQIIRNKVFSVINIMGLAIGMASAILIMLWVQDELSYDTFHKNSDSIFRVNKKYSIGGNTDYNPSTPYPLVSTAAEMLPEIKNFSRCLRRPGIIKYEDDINLERRVCATDSGFFRMFNFLFISGDRETALTDPNSIIITRKIAAKYFKEKDVLGQNLTFDDKEYIVKGVIENIPENSSINFDIFIPLDRYVNGERKNDWGSHYLISYIEIQKSTDYLSLEKNMSALLQENLPTEDIGVIFQPLSKLHLYSISGEPDGMKQLWFFSIIAIFIILIACINYMNLSTARASKRAKEVGIRKLVGVNQKKLIRQFLGESLLYSFLAIIIAFILVELTRPAFNNITEKSLIIDYFSLNLIAGVIIMLIITTLLSGSYPAFILASFKPIIVLKGRFERSGKGYILRRVLVIIQFTVTIILMISTGIIYSQLRFMDKTDLGFEKKDVVFLNLTKEISNNYDNFKNEILSFPDIVNVSRASEIPSNMYSIMRGITWEGKETDGGAAFGFAGVDPDFFTTMKIDIIIGRSFSDNFASDSNAIIFNQKAIDMTGLKNPIGKRINLGNDSWYNIIGVAKDFNAMPLNYEIEPMLFTYENRYFNNIIIRINSNEVKKSMLSIEKVWKSFSPEFPFRYTFLEDSIIREYGDKERSGKLFGYFVILAIIISCLGLFGLASFIAEQKIKELGIRKVLGASALNIITIFSSEFIKWVIISFALAIPVSILIMKKWLQSFAYKTEMHWWIFIVAGLLAIIISILTVSTQAIKSVRKNPVDSLRHE
ncbi:ABC transporter permease [Bacteroidota bacterium]